MNSFIIYSFVFLVNIYQALGQCSLYKECFNCSYSIDPPCDWKKGSCSDAINPPASYSPFYTQFDNCDDNASERIRQKYCGPSSLILDDKKAETSLPLVDGKYGTPYILCKYTFINDDEKNNLLINIKIRRGSQLESFVYIEARFFDGSVADRMVDKYDFLVGVEKGREVDFYYFANSSFDDKPFMLYIKTEKPGISVTLIVTIVLVIAACLICSVSVYVFSRRIALRNRIQRNMEVGGIIVNGQAVQGPGGSRGENEEEVRKRKKDQLDAILTTSLLQKEYNDDLAKYNNTCTICIEEYNKLSLVCLTPCNHVFHYECIKSWLTKNLLNSKCPNCNFHLLPEVNITSNTNNNPHQIVNNVYVSASYPNPYPPHANQNSFNTGYPQLQGQQQPIGNNIPYSSINANNMPQLNDQRIQIEEEGQLQSLPQLQPVYQLHPFPNINNNPQTNTNM